MSESEVVENLIVGSGPAGIATGMALRRRQAPFEVLDVGYDLDPGTELAVSRLAQLDPGAWDRREYERLFPPQPISASGLESRFLFGSNFAYWVPDTLSISLEGCMTELSHGIGGFGNVWGAAMLPYTPYSLRNWPIPAAELEASYRNVLQYVPLSAEKDDLQHTFPLHTERATALDRSDQIDGLLNALGRHKTSLRNNGIEFGRARTAVDSAGGPSSCRYCGRCLDGCVYGSIFSPRLHWKDKAHTAKSGRTDGGHKYGPAEALIHKGFYVMEFKEHDDKVAVSAVNISDGSRKQWLTRRLFLAAGHFATARIIARSLRRFNEPIRVQDSQYFFFPFFSYRSFPATPRFTLAEVFLEVLNRELSDHSVHLQVYGMNSIFERTLRSFIPAPLPLTPITDRFYLFQGFLHSEVSGHLELSLTSASAKGDEVLIKGVQNPMALPLARRVKALLRRALISVGIIPPFYLQMVPPGRSFHSGGSFPMGGRHAVYSSDTLGRPAGLKRVHIVDSANFPDVASSSMGFTIMANADRIAGACGSLV